MKRKLLSVVLALLMTLSLLPAVFVPETAAAEAQPVDQAIVQGGAILHCYNWSYNAIKAALPDIAAAGYVAVQTSPVQQPKDYNGAWNDEPGNWWKLYQPLGFRIAPDNDGVASSWLGTKAELTALCDEAETYGIYVIVDIVSNHVANVTSGGYGKPGVENNNVSPQVDEELQNHPEYYHTEQDGVNDGSRYNMTQYQMGMPDLNTSNKDVQNMVLSLLKECVDCGVDGFRFDAAKHIELPNDQYCGSDFWPTVLNGVRTYAGGADKLFIYGESLSGTGYDSWVNEYITYMGLTDSQTGNAAREAAVSQNAGALAIGTYTRGDSPKDYVLWAESHDTFEDGYEGGGSRGVQSEVIVRTWAIVGARADSTALYLARPNETMGLASTDQTWKSTAVAEVNKFKTHYDGKGEFLSYDQAAKVTYIERGNENEAGAGVVISKLDGEGAVNLKAHRMTDGYYTDSVSGNTFVVSNGRIVGDVGPTGVAVVYQAATAPAAGSTFPEGSTMYFFPTGWWSSNGANFSMHLYTGGTNAGLIAMTDNDGDGVYEATVPSGNWTNVIFTRMNPAGDQTDWNYKWNESPSLTPSSGDNCYTIYGVPDSSDTLGVWFRYGKGTVTSAAGYYLVGTVTGWSLNPAYKLTRYTQNTSAEEYFIEADLLRNEGETNPNKFQCSRFKIVYSPDGVTKQTWYPEGLNNNNYGDYAGEIPVSGHYTIYFKPNHDGGDDWHEHYIYATQTGYFVRVDTADRNGKVTVDKTVAAENETVTVTVTPSEGYELDTLVYMCETGFNTGTFITTEITGTTFEMPAENATVKATFRKKFGFMTQQLLLSGEIGVQFFVNLSGWTDDQKSASYMTFAISGTGAGGLSTERVNTANATTNKKGFYGYTCYVNSIQMADTITATFHYGDNQTIEKTYSVKQYIETWDELYPNDTSKTTALIHALANYGHYVQAYLALVQGENAPHNAQMDLSYTDDSSISGLNDYGYNYTGTANFKKVTFSTVLDSTTAIRVFFTLPEGYTVGITATVNGVDTEVVEKGTNRYMVEISNIPAHQLSKEYTIIVTTTDNQTATLTLSALSYVKLMLETYTGDSDLHKAARNAAAAIYRYAKAAERYKDPTQN